MRWTIGILSLPQRAEQCATLLGAMQVQMFRCSGAGVDEVLAPQDWGLDNPVEQFRMTRGDIEILVDQRPAPSIGEKRQWVLDTARGEYVNFIDDDDSVPTDYVSTIYPLLDGVDYIGFQVELRVNGESRPLCYHSLQYKSWSRDQHGYYRNISHLNPMRTEIARQGTFTGNYGEDRNWAEQVHPRGEHYIPRVMYFYDYRPAHSEALKRRKAELDGTHH